MPGTISYRLVDEGEEPIEPDRVLMSGVSTVVASRDVGLGRWVLLGFDYAGEDPVSARILANAARMRPQEDGLRMIAPLPETIFTPGDTVNVEWAARGGRPGTVPNE